MAHGAGLVLLRLVVRRPNGWLRRHTAHGQRVTLQAQQVDLADLQQSRIGGTVWHMATGAALGFHGHVLKDEGAFLFPVALETHLVLRGTGAQLLGDKATVLIVTITTFQKSRINAVAVGPGEFRFHFGVAAVTQLRLACH